MIIKNHIIKTNSINVRVDKVEEEVFYLKKKTEELDTIVRGQLPPHEGYNVSAIIYTAHISENLKLDLQKHNSQYQPIDIKVFKDSHDRFLIIDNDVYHIGASLKDLGKKMFAFSKLNLGKELLMKCVVAC